MIITLPKDIVKIEKTRRSHKARFAFNSEHCRMIVPRELIHMYPPHRYGIDISLSKKEKSAYLQFVPRENAYFAVNRTNGYVGCKDFFKWAAQLEIPIFDNYDYTDYQIDKKNKILKLSLERK